MFEFEISPQSLEDIAQVEETVLGLGPIITESMVAETYLLTEALAESIRSEFARHNQTGATMDSMVTTQVAPGQGHIDIGGGAPYVEFGFQPHMIYASDVALHWTGGVYGEGDHWAMAVANPGYAGDPFVERAIDALDMTAFFGEIVAAAFADVEAHRLAAGLASNHYHFLRMGGIDRVAAVGSAQVVFASLIKAP